MQRRSTMRITMTICGCWVAVLLICAVCQGAPFRNLHLTFTQPDGTPVEVVGSGDEFYAVLETLDGYAVVFDPSLKAYCYARPAGDGNLVSTGTQIHQANPLALGLAKHLRAAAEIRDAEIAARRRVWEAGMQIEARWQEQKAKLAQWEAQSAGDDGGTPGVEPKTPPTFTTTGNKLGLTLLIDFDDDPATVPQAEIINFCNGDSYTGYGNNGSVKQYYRDVSNGLLTYSNVVTVYIRIPNSLHPKSYYNDVTKNAGTNANFLIRDALATLKALPNYKTQILPAFNNLTVDGNNYVVACNVLYAGGNGGVPGMGLWPNSWALVPVGAQELSSGGKKVYRYQISNIGTALTIGTFCHENGHMLCGYPDLYDVNYTSWGVGDWCLMGLGSYGGSPSGANPSQICAYLKRASGWATTTSLSTTSVLTATLTATAGTNFNRFYRLQKPGATNEYFLAECRYQTGHDADLPGSGVLIWHLDELGNNTIANLKPNTIHSNYEATVVQADGLWELEGRWDYFGHGGDDEDLYYFGNGASGYANQFTDSSSPNAHWWDGSASGVKFSGFSAPATTMTFVVGNPNVVLNLVSTTLNGGSGDQSIDPVECDDLTVVIRNDGKDIASNVSASLSTTNAGVAVVQPGSTYPNIAAGSTATNIARFKISTGPSLVCGAPVSLALVLSYSGGSSTNIINLATGGTNYVITQSTGAAIVPGTTDIGNHGHDDVTSVALPFTWSFYGRTVTNANLSSNGNLQFSSANNSHNNNNTCLPFIDFSNAILPFWDHLRTDAPGSGIFTSISGSAPNRIFNLEWRATYQSSGALVNFEVRLYEGQQRFDMVYGTLNGTGSGATVGVQKDTGSAICVFECNTGGLSPGLQLTFEPACSQPDVLYVDRSNNGAITNGAICTPFRTVAEAYQAAGSGDTLCILTGNYPGALMNLNKTLLLQATNGVVNIGTP